MRLYIAGQWAKREAIREHIKALEDRGHVVTHDWTQHGASQGKTQEQYAAEASADLKGIREADVFIAFMDDVTYAYRGTFTEMGYALGRGIPVFIVTPHTTFDPKNVYFHTNCFTWEKPWVALVPTVEDVFKFLDRVVGLSSF